MVYRWMAEISYRDDTPTDVVGFEELRDLHDVMWRSVRTGTRSIRLWSR